MTEYDICVLLESLADTLDELGKTYELTSDALGLSDVSGAQDMGTAIGYYESAKFLRANIAALKK